MGGKKISDLRVVDLRSQLERRGLDTKGNKATLVERLSQALLTEGENADDYLVGEEVDKDKSTTASSAEDNTLSSGGDMADGDVDGEEETCEAVGQIVDPAPPVTGTLSDAIDINVKDANQDTVTVTMDLKQNVNKEGDDEEEKKSCDIELATDILATTATTEEIGQEVADDNNGAEAVVVPSANSTLDEDELNLTIGEEEDKFMIDGEDVELSLSVRKSVATESLSTKFADSPVITDSKTSSQTNDTHVDCSDGKRYEKSEEGGRPHRKSKADDRNTLLVTGLSSQTAATEIKTVFKKHGKIGGVKIMSNAKDPEGSRFALVAVMSSEDALICIKNLDGFELHGRIIHVDKARAEMLSADWVRKEGSREHSKNKSKKSTPNGSTTSSTNNTIVTPATKDTIVTESPSVSSSDTTKGPVDEMEPKKSASQTLNEVGKSPKAAAAAVEETLPSTSVSDAKIKDDSKKEPKKKSPPVKATEKRLSTEKKDTTRKDVIPFQRNYHFQRRPVAPIGRESSRMIRTHPRFSHHEEDSRGDYHHHRRTYNDERRVSHHHPPPYHHQPRMVKRSRSPPERIERNPYRRGSPGGRRMGRQPELTFEEIYDTRQREKGREMERERREVERRRLEEVEKQRQLDEEFRRLAKERERIEAEKAELKRQKEKMIMEEREKQRLEQAEIEREKALLARKLKSTKRSHLEEEYAREEQKKQSLDSRRIEKEKLRSHPYRRGEEAARFSAQSRGIDSPMRGAPLRNAPVRDRRSPSWEKDRRIRDVKGSDRHGQRDRGSTRIEHTKVRGDRREESKTFPITTIASDSPTTSRYSFDTAAHYSTGVLPNQSGRIVTAITKPMDSYYTGSTGGNARGDNRWPTSNLTFPGGDSSMTNLRQPDTSWISSREPSWPGSERISTRTITEIPDRWGGAVPRLGMGIPSAPPPPIFSNSEELNSISANSFNPGMYTSSYDYKLPSLSSHRR